MYLYVTVCEHVYNLMFCVFQGLTQKYRELKSRQENTIVKDQEIASNYTALYIGIMIGIEILFSDIVFVIIF